VEYILGPPVREWRGGCLVRLGDDARKCVVFFGTPDPKTDELSVWGTGFLVRTTNHPTVYLVTAAHVIIDKQDCPFAIRYNRKDGGSGYDYVDNAKWHFHPMDRTVDVAVLEIEPPEWADDWLAFPQYSVLSDFKFETKDIGPGDLVYTVGLWRNLQGKNRNKPFVHVGHVGMVPQDDKIEVKGWINDKPVEVEAYLTEGEPLRGASGSPVFARRSIRLGKGIFRDDPNAETWVYGSVWLLGLQSDAYFECAVIDASEKFVPRGTNIVVPSMKINEVLDKDELKNKRRRDASERKQKVAVLPEKLSAAPSAGDANPNHLEDFKRLVDAAARKRPQGDQT
jgi:hypothetical protein